MIASTVRILPPDHMCPSGGIGRRRGFKIPRRKVCRFESGLGYHITISYCPVTSISALCVKLIKKMFVRLDLMRSDEIPADWGIAGGAINLPKHNTLNMALSDIKIRNLKPKSNIYSLGLWWSLRCRESEFLEVVAVQISARC